MLSNSSIPDQSAFTIEPYQPSKLESIKKILRAHKKSLIIGSTLVLVISSTALAFISPIQFNLPQAASDNTEKKGIFSSLLYDLEESSPQPSPSTNPLNQPLASSPSPSPNPPSIIISYPSENQAISMDNSQTLCLVDIPNGNTSGLQRKHKINNQGWTSYTNHFTLCFDPQEGSNTISLQYKNSLGEESNVYTRNFSFRKRQPTNLTLTSFIDNNGNGSKDGSEQGLNALLTIKKKTNGQWYKYQSANSNQQGNYSQSIIELGEYTVEPGVYTFYDKPSSQGFTVDGFAKNLNLFFAYKPTVSTAGLTIFVFNDKNENNTEDSGEEYINYQYAQITNQNTGESINLAISNSGADYSYISFGDYQIKLVPETESWNQYYTITKGQVNVNVSATSGTQTVKLGAHKLY